MELVAKIATIVRLPFEFGRFFFLWPWYTMVSIYKNPTFLGRAYVDLLTWKGGLLSFEVALLNPWRFSHGMFGIFTY